VLCAGALFGRDCQAETGVTVNAEYT
jgi:hypothetical protein